MALSLLPQPGEDDAADRLNAYLARAAAVGKRLEHPASSGRARLDAKPCFTSISSRRGILIQSFIGPRGFRP